MENNSNNNKKAGQSYIKFLGLAIQMALIILLFTYLGYWLENKLHLEKNYLTAGFSVTGVFIALYLLFKQLPKE